jgi:hypothetical protein
MVAGWGIRARIGAWVVILAVLASGVLGRYTALANTVDGELASSGGSLAARVRGQGPPGLEVARIAAQDAPTCDVNLTLETPGEGESVSGNLYAITGFAADLASAEGTGIQGVTVALDTPADQGGTAVPVPYGTERTDVAELLGDPRFTNSGFRIDWNTQSTSPGPHTLYIEAQTACGPQLIARPVSVATTNDPLMNPVSSAPSSSAAAAAQAAVQAAAGAGGAPASGGAAATTPTAGTPGTPTVLVPTATPTTGGPGVIQITPNPPAPTGSTGVAATAPGGAAAAAPAAGPSIVSTATIPAPANVTVAMSPFGDAVSLTWAAPPVQVVAYRIVTNESDGSHRTVQEVPGNLTTGIVRGLNPRIGHSLSVVAMDGQGRPSAPSPPVTTAGAPTMTPMPTPTLAPWCTPSPGPGMPPFCPGPGAFPGQFPNQYAGTMPGMPGYPGGVYPGAYGAGSFQVTATLLNPTTATLTWTPPPGAVSYTIWQGVNGAPPVPSGIPATGTTATVPLAQPGASYVFQVHALGPTGQELGVSNITPPLSSSGIGVTGAAGVPSAAHSQVIVPPTVSIATAPEGAPISVLVRDANGVALPNAAVTLTAATPGAVVVPVLPTTDPSGTATFRLQAPPGAVTLTATVNGVALPPASLSVTP